MAFLPDETDTLVETEQISDPSHEVQQSYLWQPTLYGMPSLSWNQISQQPYPDPRSTSFGMSQEYKSPSQKGQHLEIAWSDETPLPAQELQASSITCYPILERELNSQYTFGDSAPLVSFDTQLDQTSRSMWAVPSHINTDVAIGQLTAEEPCCYQSFGPSQV